MFGQHAAEMHTEHEFCLVCLHNIKNSMQLIQEPDFYIIDHHIYVLQITGCSQTCVKVSGAQYRPLEAQLQTGQGVGEAARAWGFLDAQGHHYCFEEEVREIMHRVLKSGIVLKVTLKDEHDKQKP